jgi:hypothetical protein
MELFSGQTARLPDSLRYTFDLYQTDWVNLHRNVLLPHSEIPQGTENATNVGSTFGSKSEGLQPHFYRSRL